MPLVSDSWSPGLSQNGPPPGANDDVFLVTHWYRKSSVAAVRAMPTRLENKSRMLMLTGQDSAYDGLLQGIYTYVPTEELDVSLANNASYILVDDRRSAWRKIT